MVPFKLEEFWKKYEFTAPYILCGSDAETWTMSEILALADVEMKKLWDTLPLGYTQVPGLPLLREEIAKLYTELKSDDIITFAGAEEGIYCAMRTLIEKGDHVVVIEPCYQSLLTLPQEFGADISSVVLKDNWKLDLKAVEKVMRPNTKLLVLNYPHNPTGTLLEKEVFEGLIQLARKCGAYIFSDEVYRYLEIDETKRLPSMADAYEKGVTVNVMTKAFGLAGLRIGWLATRDAAALEKAGAYKLYTSICNSAPSEILAVMALRAKETILKRNREVMLSNFALLKAFMERNKELFSWQEPESGSVAVIQARMPVEKFAQDLVEETGVLIMPGSILDLPGNYFRIGFGKKGMSIALEKLEQYAKAYSASHAIS